MFFKTGTTKGKKTNMIGNTKVQKTRNKQMRPIKQAKGSFNKGTKAKERKKGYDTKTINNKKEKQAKEAHKTSKGIFP